MTRSLPKGGNVALAQADSAAARTLFVGLSWEASPAAPSVEIDASLFLLNASGLVRDDRDFVFSDSAYRLMLLSKTGIARCELLEKLWRKKVALSAESLLAAILNEEVLNKIRAVLLRERGYPLTNQEIQDAIEREILR